MSESDLLLRLQMMDEIKRVKTDDVPWDHFAPQTLKMLFRRLSRGRYLVARCDTIRALRVRNPMFGLLRGV